MKISILQPGTYGNEKWPFEGIQIKIWRAVAARWGRPTQGFGRPHMGLSGLHYFLTGWGAQGGPRASGFGFYLCAEDFEKCRILLGL